MLYHGTSSARLKGILREGRLGHHAPGATPILVPTAPAFVPGMTVRFHEYPPGGSGIFAPNEDVYIQSMEEVDHPFIKGKRNTVYCCISASDKEGIRSDPQPERMEPEKLFGQFVAT